MNNGERTARDLLKRLVSDPDQRQSIMYFAGEKWLTFFVKRELLDEVDNYLYGSKKEEEHA